MIVAYVPDPAEEPEITAMREAHCAEVRAFVRRYGSDPSVSDLDFAHSLHRLTYDQARTLCTRALEIYNTQGGTDGDG